MTKLIRGTATKLGLYVPGLVSKALSFDAIVVLLDNADKPALLEEDLDVELVASVVGRLGGDYQGTIAAGHSILLLKPQLSVEETLTLLARRTAGPQPIADSSSSFVQARDSKLKRRIAAGVRFQQSSPEDASVRGSLVAASSGKPWEFYFGMEPLWADAVTGPYISDYEGRAAVQLPSKPYGLAVSAPFGIDQRFTPLVNQPFKLRLTVVDKEGNPCKATQDLSFRITADTKITGEPISVSILTNEVYKDVEITMTEIRPIHIMQVEAWHTGLTDSGDTYVKAGDFLHFIQEWPGNYGFYQAGLPFSLAYSMGWLTKDSVSAIGTASPLDLFIGNYFFRPNSWKGSGYYQRVEGLVRPLDQWSHKFAEPMYLVTPGVEAEMIIERIKASTEEPVNFAGTESSLLLMPFYYQLNAFPPGTSYTARVTLPVGTPRRSVRSWVFANFSNVLSYTVVHVRKPDADDEIGYLDFLTTQPKHASAGDSLSLEVCLRDFDGNEINAPKDYTLGVLVRHEASSVPLSNFSGTTQKVLAEGQSRVTFDDLKWPMDASSCYVEVYVVGQGTNDADYVFAAMWNGTTVVSRFADGDANQVVDQGNRVQAFGGVLRAEDSEDDIVVFSPNGGYKSTWLAGSSYRLTFAGLTGNFSGVNGTHMARPGEEFRIAHANGVISIYWEQVNRIVLRTYLWSGGNQTITFTGSGGSVADSHPTQFTWAPVGAASLLVELL